MVGGDRVEKEIETAGVLLHLACMKRGHLAWRWKEMQGLYLTVSVIPSGQARPGPL